MAKNQLSEETSEYLLQHKDNPVHWWPWGEAAFKEAEKTRKPILLSVGYAACHWCHVMAHESFEDPHVAGIMNELFVNIKLDREERPDIDKVYMTALQHLGEQGGWPLTMFLTPKGEPFWGGTYFPKKPKYGRPGFTAILEKISEIYKNEPEKIGQNSRALRQALESSLESHDQKGGKLNIALVLEQLSTIMDKEKGGPKGAPKFPQAPLLSFFWFGYYLTRKNTYKNIVITSLVNICQGGIYDHLGGGFSRYCVDENWLVPHFEKMTYDNAQIISLLNKALLEKENSLFRVRIEETIDWLIREMRHEKGAFYASLDADSEGEEGKYYLWSEEEIRDILPKNLFDSFVKTYGVDSHGNWEGKNILNRLSSLELYDDKKEGNLKNSRDKLLNKRERRIKPGLDDKILTDWNGLLVSALLESSIQSENEDWFKLAYDAFNFILNELKMQNKLAHSYAKGRATHPALLDDYAFITKAALGFYEITNEKLFLKQAELWIKELNDCFWSAEQGAYFMSSKEDGLLFTRLISAADEATPNGNAVMIENLTRLYSFTGNKTYIEKAEKIVNSFDGSVAQNIFSHSTYLTSRDFFENYSEIMIFPSPQEKNFSELISECLKLPHPHKIIHLYRTEIKDSDHPAYGKTHHKDKVTYYLCQNRTCSAPLMSIEELKLKLDDCF